MQVVLFLQFMEEQRKKKGLQKLLEDRSKYYKQAHLTVESKFTDKKSEIVKSILVNLRQWSIIEN